MSYAADVSPNEAYEALTGSSEAVLVDVRTHAEWTYVGVPLLTDAGREPVFAQWSSYPGGTLNEAFLEQVRGAGVEPGQPIYCLCRSGVRSAAAAEALTAAGLGPAYNVVDGFEGQHDEEHHRTVGGWKNSGLPWRQG